MAKQLNVDLNFRANTGNATASISELRNLLNQIAVGVDIKVDANNLQKASSAAKELQLHLNRAFNETTGNFDLSKLDKSLKMSKTNIMDLSRSLLSAGTTGEQAFVKLAQSISMADRPMIGINAKLKEFGTTLANTARWQISSSILHGFMGALQSAYGYAQDLNESLNNIRIVTGASVEEMDKFAEKANQAAKALSTTTTAYTNASLIYYQQGLSDEEVIARTDVTIKMANAAGESAEKVSDQLTAVWNNFYDGSQSLEYYADAMTALGAATASSTDEIAQGLEKFAAVADTVGLSYEYATAALATVTATTRQSADVVGTAFKTLFARLSDLKLGETLDDGTTLGSYSENLAKIGVNIKDASGQLKDMDTILNETAAKWENLDKAQQVALAKGVAGIRQYTQFIALMDNWDFMKENLNTIETSGGVLQNQADTYAESWDAAKNRVTASLETIYSQLLDDEFFIDITDGFASLLNSVAAFIDGIGGIKTILIGVASIFLSNFAGKIEPALLSLKHSFSVVFQSAQVQANALTQQMNQMITKKINADQSAKQTGGAGIGMTQSSITALENAKGLNEAKIKLLNVEKQLSQEERERYQQELGFLEAAQKEAQLIADNITKRKQEIQAMSDASVAFDNESATRDLENQRGQEHQDLIDRRAAVRDGGDPLVEGDTLDDLNAKIIAHSQATDEMIASREEYGQAVYNAYAKEMEASNGAIQAGQKVYNSYELLGDSVIEYYDALTNLDAATLDSNQSFSEQVNTFNELKSEISAIAGDTIPELDQALNGMSDPKDVHELREQIDQVKKALLNSEVPAENLEKILRKMGQGKSVSKLQSQYKLLQKEQDELKRKQELVNKAFQNFKPQHVAKGIESISKTAAGLGSLAMAAQSIRSVFQAWNNDDLSIGEKITTTVLSLSMALPMLTKGISDVRTGFSGLISAAGNMASTLLAQMTLSSSATDLLTGKITAQNLAKQTGITLDQAQAMINQAKLASITAEALAQGKLNEEQAEGILMDTLDLTSDQAAAVVSKIKAGATMEEALAEQGLTTAKSGGILASLTATLTKWGEVVANKAKTVADSAETTGIWAKVAAYIAEQAAAAPVLVVTLLIVAALVALAAIVTVVVLAIQALCDWWNKDAIAAEKAAQAAKELKENYETVKQAYEDLMASIDKYKSARDALDDLVEGTDEWNKALKEANRAAMDLIKNNPELFERGEDYRWENGQLIIDEDAMAAAETTMAQNEQLAYGAMLVGEAQAKKAAAKAERTDNIRSLGSSFNEVGTSAALGGIPGLIKGISDFGEATKEFGNRMEKVADQMDQASEQMKLAGDAIAQSIAESEFGESEVSEDLAKAVNGKQYEQFYDQAMSKLELTGWGTAGIAQIDGANAEAKKIFNEYVEAAGLSGQGLKLTDTEGDDDNRVFVYLDSEGNEKKVSLEAMRTAKANAMANQGIENAMAIMEPMLLELNDRIEAGIDKQGKKDSGARNAQATKDFLTNKDFATTSRGDLNSLASFDAKAYDQANFMGLSHGENAKAMDAELDKMFGGEDGKLSNDELKAMGYTGFGAKEKLIKDIQAAQEAANKEWESIEKTVVKNMAGFDDMSLDLAKKFESAVNKMNLGPMGEKAGKQFVDGLNKMTEGLDSEERTAALEQLADIDWTNPDALEQADEIMQQYGIDIERGSEEWKKFAEDMQRANQAFPDFTTLKDDLIQVNKLLSDLNFGDVVSEEDYEAIKKLGEGYEDFFILQADGTRKFIGNAEEMKKASMEELKQKQKELAERKKIHDDAKEAGLTDWTISDREAEIAAGGDGKDGLFSFANANTAGSKAAKEMGFTVTENKNIWGKVKSTTIKDKDGNVVSAADMSKKIIGKEKAEKFESDLLNQPGVKEALAQQGYDDKAIAEIIKEAKEGNADRLNTMLDSLNTFMTEDYETATKELYEMTAAMATSADELNQMLEEGTIDLDAYNKQIQVLASQVTSLEQLDELIANANIAVEMQAEAYKNLASQYENCTKELEEYLFAVSQGNETAIKKAEGLLRASIMIGEAAEEFDLDANALEVQAKQLAKAYGLGAEAAANLAIKNQRMNKGIDSLKDNWQKWKKELKGTDKTTWAYAESVAELTKSFKDLIGVTEDFQLPDDFFESEKIMGLLDQAAAGSTKAIDLLGIEAAKASVGMLQFDAALANSMMQAGVNWNEVLADPMKGFQENKNAVMAGFDELFTAIESGSLRAGDAATMLGEDWINNMNDMAVKTGMSVEEMQNMLNSMGLSADVEVTTIDTMVKTPKYRTYQRKISDADAKAAGYESGTETVTVQNGYDYVPGTIDVASIAVNGDAPDTSITYTGSGRGGGSPGGSGGGGGGSKAPAEKKKKTDVVDRYKEVTDSLEDVTQATEKANKATDGLYGLAKIKNMEKVNSLLKQEIGLYGKKRKEAIANLALDKKTITEAADAAGVSLTFDADGDISNYTTELTKLVDQYNNAVDAAGDNVDETEQKNFDELDEKINNLKDAISQYEETKALLFELDQQEIDKFNEILSNNFEKINAKLELDIEFNEQDLAWIEYQLSKIEDDVYSTTEAMALMWNSDGTESQYNEYVQNLESYKANMDDLQTAYENGTISQAAYVEGMKAVSEGMLDNLSNILELDKAMKEYYSNTLSMAQDEISKYTDLIDNAASALEHYSSLMELFGKTTDYTSMGRILEAQVQVSKDAYDSSAAAYKMFNNQALAAKKAYEDALANTSYTGDIDMLKEQWLTAQSIADEAYEEMLSDAETFAENMRTVLENALAGFAQELENALTGDFGSFDALSTELERASSLQEEFLTTTNKIYETNKMMRAAQKEIDKTTNQMAKRKLKQFINETNALQEQGELSQYELEVQQAKYDLLLAEIALKEAQNAKSTVRLQRDSEGNFGYVYTADQSAIDDAQQKFEDSQNALYNKSLEGANDYAQKYIETMSEMNDTLAEINQQYLDGEFESQKEYEEAIKRAKDYYYKQLENYSNLYQVAIGTDARVTGDSWSKAFGQMTTQTEIWKTKTDEYIGNTQSAFAAFDTALKPIKDSLSASAKSIENITKESKKLRDTLTNSENGVIKALTEELSAVKQVTEAYAAQKKTIDELIASYESLAQEAGNAARTEAYDPTAIAPGSGVILNGVTSWSNVGESADNSEAGPNPYNTNYTVLRWNEGKDHVLISDGAGNHGWVPIDKVSAFDTGGYTGSWGSYGKMAMVHEKELILNPHDTENFLASIEFLHKILEIIDLQAMSSQLGGILTSPSLNHNNTSVIEQDVHIEATFPNVVNHSEIEEAFNNLINLSSQYANRK